MVDPAVYARPIVFTTPMALRPDTEMLEGVCENHRNSNARISAAAPAEVIDVPASTLAGFVGTCEFNADGKPYVVDVSFDGRDLWFDYLRKGKELLVPLFATRFSWYGAIVEFSVATDGRKTIAIYQVESEEHGGQRVD